MFEGIEISVVDVGYVTIYALLCAMFSDWQEMRNER